MGSASGPAALVSPAASIYAGLQSSADKAQAANAQAAGENAGDQAQADRLDRAAEYGHAAAEETNAQLSENLNVQLGNIDAVRAAARVDPTSPTTAALSDRTDFMANRTRAIQVGNINAQADQNTSDATYLRSAGAYALKMGKLGADATMLGGYAAAGDKIAKTATSSFGVGK